MILIDILHSSKPTLLVIIPTYVHWLTSSKNGHNSRHNNLLLLNSEASTIIMLKNTCTGWLLHCMWIAFSFSTTNYVNNVLTGIMVEIIYSVSDTTFINNNLERNYMPLHHIITSSLDAFLAFL